MVDVTACIRIVLLTLVMSMLILLMVIINNVILHPELPTEVITSAQTDTNPSDATIGTTALMGTTNTGKYIYFKLNK